MFPGSAEGSVTVVKVSMYSGNVALLVFYGALRNAVIIGSCIIVRM